MSFAPLTIGRVHYDGGGDWYANPSSLPNLLRAIRERTTLQTTEHERVVRLTDPDLADVPYLYMTGHGNVLWSPDEVRALRAHLETGGFLHADDCYGMDKSIRREIAKAFPDRPFVEVPLDHPIYHVVYEFPRGIPKIHEHDGLPAQGFGIFMEGRLVLYYSYQSDLGDGWEDPDVHHDPAPIREQAIRMGVNLFVYAVTLAAGPDRAGGATNAAEAGRPQAGAVTLAAGPDRAGGATNAAEAGGPQTGAASRSA